MPSYTYDHVSGDSRRALEVFSDQFRSALALGDVDQWASEMGVHVKSDTLKTTYPIPVSAAGYKELEGDLKYRSLYERSLSMKIRRWQDGVAELEDIVSKDGFIGWLDQPAAMAAEAVRQPNEWVAARLEANPNLDFYKDETLGTDAAIAMFHASHPVNVFDDSKGTFNNLNLTGSLASADAIDTMFSAIKTKFRARKGPNGKPLGTKFTHLLAPASMEQSLSKFLENETLIRAVKNAAGTENVAAGQTNNTHREIKLMISDELTSGSYVYALALNKPGLVPWIIQTEPAPEEIIQDKTSALYQTQLKVAIAYILRGNAELALPHCIERVTIS